MDVVLVAGLWLRRSAWADVATELQRLGYRAIVVAVPGVDDDPPISPAGVALADQVAAVVAAVDACERPIVVGHSAACTLAWIAADRRPDDVAGVVMVGGFPAAHGAPYASFFDVVDGVMPFPGWEPFEGPDSADLDAAQRDAFAADAVPVPAGVAAGIVELGDERRFGVPVLLVCPEYSPAQAQEWIAAGELPELARATSIAYADIDSGHWPMLTQPAELARIIATATAP